MSIRLYLNPVTTAFRTLTTRLQGNPVPAKNNETQFRLVFEAAPNGMIMVDQSGKIVLINSQIEKMFGYTRGELINRTIESLVPERFRHHHPQFRRDFSKDPQTRPMGAGRDLFGRRKDGSEFPVEIGLNPLKTRQGLYVIGSIVDITERKLTEEKIKKANEELQHASEVKSNFISMVSHELRTPLSSMKSGIDLLLEELDGPISESQKETLSIVKNNIDRLARLINHVLDYTKMEAGKLQLVLAPVDLTLLIKEVSKLIEAELKAKGLQFYQEIPNEPLIFICDADKIKQVLINLLNNAIKFTESGTITVRLTATPQQASIDIEDTGIGIKLEDQQKIFEMFGQVFSRGLWKIGGSGVGLAVSKLIVEHHHGQILVNSTPGKGSCFTVVLPATQEVSLQAAS